tara:strand:- start:197 stop:568 length:372 start_codon:yes stop_codon:yes gene_type:complete
VKYTQKPAEKSGAMLLDELREQEDIMTDNQIIAEFMGMTEDPNDKSVMIQMTPQGNEVVPIESMEYHTSWDWLMPVANEIIKSRDEQNADWDLTNLKYALQTTNIEYVYKAVVEFINENNKRK